MARDLRVRKFRRHRHGGECGHAPRGNTSREAAKKSFKVSFNTFTPGASWNGLEKLNLNGNHNDPSMLRARMVWDFMRAQGHVAPRVSHVRVLRQRRVPRAVHQRGTRGRRVHSKALQARRRQFVEVHVSRGFGLPRRRPRSVQTDPWWSDQRVYELKTNTVEDDYSAIANCAR